MEKTPMENTEQTEQMEQMEGQTEQTEQKEQKEITPTLEAWDSLTTEQQTTLKDSLLKSKYGIGGEQFSTFPTLLVDSKTNIWVTEKYNPKGLPKRVTETTFKQWASNGELQILPLLKGEKIHYLTIIKPNKNIKLDLWELDKTDIKPFQEYTTKNLIGQINLGKTHFHILNSYTNKNKAYNQSNLLVKLFQLGTPPKTLEGQKDLLTNYLQLDITKEGKYILKEISKNTHKPTGKTFQTIGDYINRKQHGNIKFNYLEHIN